MDEQIDIREKKIELIKIFRKVTGFGLVDSKFLVEFWQNACDQKGAYFVAGMVVFASKFVSGVYRYDSANQKITYGIPPEVSSSDVIRECVFNF